MVVCWIAAKYATTLSPSNSALATMRPTVPRSHTIGGARRAPGRVHRAMTTKMSGVVTVAGSSLGRRNRLQVPHDAAAMATLAPPARSSDARGGDGADKAREGIVPLRHAPPADRRSAPPRSPLQEVHDVAVLHDVLLALAAQLAGGLDRGFAAELLEVSDRVDLGADEFSLEVAVDDAGSLGGERALADRPRPDLLLAGGEVRLQAEQAVALARER